MLFYFVKCLEKYFDFSGRARRAEFWSFFAIKITILLLIFLSLLDPSGVAMMVSAIFPLAFLPPTLSLAARRFHDVGLSAWSLLAVFVPLVGLLVILVIVALFPSEPHANRFGRHPKTETRRAAQVAA